MTLADIRLSFLNGTITADAAYGLARGCGMFPQEAAAQVEIWEAERRDAWVRRLIETYGRPWAITEDRSCGTD